LHFGKKLNPPQLSTLSRVKRGVIPPDAVSHNRPTIHLQVSARGNYGRHW